MAKTTEAKLQERVEAGAAFLNVVYPRWYKHMNTKILDLGDPHKCVLGELYGGYSTGKDALDIEGQLVVQGNGTVTKASLLGFDTELPYKNYAVLTKLWVKKIKSLLKQK